jgi:hypothetical protein
MHLMKKREKQREQMEQMKQRIAEVREGPGSSEHACRAGPLAAQLHSALGNPGQRATG